MVGVDMKSSTWTNSKSIFGMGDIGAFSNLYPAYIDHRGTRFKM